MNSQGRMHGNKYASEWEGAVTSIPSKPAAFPAALAPPTYIISWSPQESRELHGTSINDNHQFDSSSSPLAQFPPMQDSALDRNQESTWRIAGIKNLSGE